jgi:hypothetical protein
MLRHGLGARARSLDWCAHLLRRGTPDGMNLVPVLLTWHSTLYNRHPLHTIATYTYCSFWEDWAWQLAEYQTSATASTEAHSFSAEKASG